MIQGCDICRRNKNINHIGNETACKSACSWSWRGVGEEEKVEFEEYVDGSGDEKMELEE